MAGDSRLSARFGSDTADFKTGVVAIRQEIRVLESDFRANASALGDWEESADGVELRIKSLSGIIELQKEKVSALTVEYERIVEAKGKDSVAAQNKLIELNNETSKLNELNNELGEQETALSEMTTASDEAAGAVNEVGEAANDTATETKEAASASDTFKSALDGLGSVAKIAAGAIVGIAGAGIAAAAGIAKIVFDAAASAEELTDLSVKSGISTERLQELAYVGDQLGTSQETIVGSLSKLTKNMAAATSQQAEYAKGMADAKAKGEPYTGTLGDVAKAFETLGVSVTDSSGNLRDNEDVFADALEALGKMPNEAERDALAMQLFGKSAQELNPLIKAGADEIANLSQEARDNGAVMSTEAVQGLADFQDSWDGLMAGIKGIAGSLAVMFLPIFQDLTAGALGFLQQLVATFQESGGNFAVFGKKIGGVAGQLITWLAVNLPKAIQTLTDYWTTTLFPALQKLWDWLSVNLPPAIQALANFWTTTLWPAIQAVWQWMNDFLFPTLQVLWDWISPILSAALQYLADYWTTILMPSIKIVWTWMTTFLFPTLSVLWTRISATLTTAIQTLSDYWTNTLQPAMKAVHDWINTYLVPLFNAIVELFNVTLTLAINTLATLWETIFKPALKVVGDYLADILQPAFQGLVDFWNNTLGPLITTVSGWFKDTIAGSINSIQSAIENAIGWIEDLIKAIQNIPPLPGFGGTSGSSAGYGTSSMRAGIESLIQTSNLAIARSLLSPAMAPANNNIGGDTHYYIIQNEASANAVLSQVAERQRKKLNASMAR